MSKDIIKIVAPVGIALLCSCNPTVKVEAPDKPIVVDLNVKIEHKVKLKIQKELEESIQKDSELF